jgi:RNA polymerase sigma-70 factor (ECF subfamily)
MASRDEEFARFFDEFYPSLCRFLACLLGGQGAGASSAQDIAQDAFLQLHRAGFETFPAGEARFWLFRVARNLALNELGKRQTRQRLFDKVATAFRAHVPTPAEDFEMTELKTRVAEMLTTLPEHQRAALLLREQEEMSYREIADVLSVSEAKVKVDIFRARASLRERWGKTQHATVARGNAG